GGLVGQVAVEADPVDRAVGAGVIPVVTLGQPGGASRRLELEEADLVLQIDQLFGRQSTVRSCGGIELDHSPNRTNVRNECQVKNYAFLFTQRLPSATRPPPSPLPSLLVKSPGRATLFRACLPSQSTLRRAASASAVH